MLNCFNMSENTPQNIVYNVEAVFLANPDKENQAAAKQFYEKLVAEVQKWAQIEDLQVEEKVLEASYEILVQMRDIGEITADQFNVFFREMGESVETVKRIFKEKSERESKKGTENKFGIIDTAADRRGPRKL